MSLSFVNRMKRKMFLDVSPVTRARVHIQEKVETSKFILCRLAENSTMLSIHSPKPRRHWSRCHTDPSQKISFPSSGLDLKCYNSLWLTCEAGGQR